MNEDLTSTHDSPDSSSGRRARRALALAALLGLAAAGPAWAQTTPSATTPTAPAAPATEPKPVAEGSGPNTGRLSVSAGVDWTSAYFFRGIKQETEDLILQPYGELTFKLVENAGALTSLSLTAGIWNSLHTGSTG